MRNRTRLIAVVSALALALVPAFLATSNKAQAKPFNYNSLKPIQKRILSGAASYALGSRFNSGNKGATSAQHPGGDNEAAGEAPSTPPKNYYPTDTKGCPTYQGIATKVNQDCTTIADGDLQGRSSAQNETTIAYDTTTPANLVATANDYRRGDGTCGSTYSHDGGKTWADTTVPNGFTRGDAFGGGKARQYWQAAGDTSVAWDTRGNAYLSCQVFNRGSAVSQNPDQSSAFYVYRATDNGGASYNFPGRAVRENNDGAGLGDVLLDKQWLTVDNHTTSPYRDRVYVTWTEFAADGTGYIYESFSKDYGETFSAPALVSRGGALCDQTYGLPTPRGTCNENQFSVPFVASDGTLYVTYNNYNNKVTGGENRNQVLITKSVDGGHTFSVPTRVSYYYDLPDCYAYTGQDFGRACLPTKSKVQNSYFRAWNYPSPAVDPANPKHVVVTFGSYINKNSKESNGCVPGSFDPDTGQDLYTGVRTDHACNNDILITSSTDGGTSFGSTDPRTLRTVNSTAGQAESDQFFQWATFTPNGRFVATYYDRQYTTDRYSGFSGITLSSSRTLTSWTNVNVTNSAQMPPPTQFSGLFYGDYIGLTATDTTAHPVWSDTRDRELFLCPGTGTAGHPPTVCYGDAANATYANDQNSYTARVALPTS
jgi:hypothetical protein